jgi:hypothetical protein
MKFRVFWNVAPCSQVDVDYMALHPRRLNFTLHPAASLYERKEESSAHTIYDVDAPQSCNINTKIMLNENILQ